jgi:hypothetical protein
VLVEDVEHQHTGLTPGCRHKPRHDLRYTSASLS